MSFAPVGRRGYYTGEQYRAPDGGTYTWIPTRQRWELSSGKPYNIIRNTNPQQAYQNAIAAGKKPAEAEKIRKKQVNILTNPTEEYKFNASVVTGDGVEIRDVQSERGALEQIIQRTNNDDPRQRAAIEELNKKLPPLDIPAEVTKPIPQSNPKPKPLHKTKTKIETYNCQRPETKHKQNKIKKPTVCSMRSSNPFLSDIKSSILVSPAAKLLDSASV